MRLKFVVCKHETREMSSQESGENRRIPKSSPPHPFFPYQRAGSKAKWIMLHAFLSASLQDNLWNSE